MIKLSKKVGPLFWALILIGLGSCGDKAPSEAVNVSTFSVLTVESKKNALFSEGVEAGWKSLSNTLVLGLSACLKDSAVAASIVGETFKISSDLSETTEVSDANGCLHWNERLHFDATAPEAFYELTLTITGTSNYKGSETIALALAPNIENESKLYDLRFQKLPYPLQSLRSLTSAHKELAPVNSLLDFNNFSLNLSRYENRGETLQYNYEWEAGVDLLREDIDGVSKRFPLQSGLFKATFALVEFQSTGAAPRVNGLTFKEVQIHKGRIKTSLSFDILKKLAPAESSDLRLLVELVPKNAPVDLGLLSGALDMNRFQSAASSSWRQEEISMAQLQEQMRRALAEKEEEKIDLVASSPAPLQEEGELVIDQMIFNYGSFDSKEYNLKATRSLHSKLSFCLVDPFAPAGSKALTGEDFQVEIFNEESEVLSSTSSAGLDQSGCLSHTLNLRFSRFGPERYFNYKVVVRGLSGKTKDMRANSRFALNPWNEADFGFDLSKRTPTPLKSTRRPRLLLGDVGYSYEGLDYESFKINNFLHLSFHRFYQFNFAPLVQSFASTGKEEVPALTFGKIKISAFIFSPRKDGLDYINPDLSEFDFLSATEKVFSLDAKGSATDVLSFPFFASETHLLGLKNLLVLKASWSEDGKEFNRDLEAVTMTMPFYPAKPEMSAYPTVAVDLDLNLAPGGPISNLLLAQTKYLPGPSTSAIDLYRKDLSSRYQTEGVHFIFKKAEELRADFSESLSPEETRLLSSVPGSVPPRILAKLCAPLRVQAKECATYPERYVESKALSHIAKILSTHKREGKNYGAARFVGKELGNIYRGEGYFASWGDRYWNGEGESITTTRKIGADSMIGPPPFLVSIGGGLSKAWENFYTEQEGKMQAAFDRNFTQRTKVNLDYNKMELEFLAEVNNCFIATSLTPPQTVMHICEEKTRLKKMREEWYFIGPANDRNHGLLVDNQSVQDVELSQIIRGRTNYNRLWGNFRKEDVTLVMAQIKDQVIADSFIESKGEGLEENPFDHYSDNAFPGAFIPFEF